MKLYIMRHAESAANVGDVLAGRLDTPLSPRGVQDADAIAEAFLRTYRPDAVYCSPLIRAVQTARPFVLRLALPLRLDERLQEHDIGGFTGKTYAEAERDPAYEKRREMRWNWLPPGGESYRMIAERVASFLGSIDTSPCSCLIVTHAVTMRLLRGVLEATLPRYPQEIAKNGEIWEVDFTEVGAVHEIRVLSAFDGLTREHRV
jgi:broad specificity phosphatase PhoE